MPHRLYVVVAARARHQCEYCLAPEVAFNLEFEVDHVIPIARGGTDDLANLALACRSCNARKGTSVESRDPASRQDIALFNPRTQDWSAHFELHLPAARIEGLTPAGRATVERLGMNRRQATRARRLWLLRLFEG